MCLPGKYASGEEPVEVNSNPYRKINNKIVNDTHRKRLVLHSVQYRNGWLATSDLFHMFTQSIKSYTFYYQYRCLKYVIHQIISKNRWLLLSTSLPQNLG